MLPCLQVLLDYTPENWRSDEDVRPNRLLVNRYTSVERLGRSGTFGCSIALLSNSVPRLVIDDPNLVFSATGSPCSPTTVFVLVLMRVYSPLPNMTCIGSSCFQSWLETSTYFRCWYCLSTFATSGCQTSFNNFRLSYVHLIITNR